MTRKTLSDIGLKYGTDKSTYHKFMGVYDRFFDPVRDSTTTVLEIGIYTGSSLRTWSEYFKNAQIFGVDIERSRLFSEGRIQTCYADQTDRTCLEGLPKIFGVGSFDIIIDDGGHTMEQQQITIGALFKYLKPNGFYVIEDLQTSFWTEYGAKDRRKSTLGVVADFCRTKIFNSPYLSRDENQYLSSQIKSISIFDTKGDLESITSLIQKN